MSMPDFRAMAVELLARAAGEVDETATALESAWKDGWTARKLATFDPRGLSSDQMRAVALSAELERLREAVLDVLIEHQHAMPEAARERLRKAVGRVE